MNPDQATLVTYTQTTRRLIENGIVTFRRGDTDLMTHREARNLAQTGQVEIVGNAKGRVDVATEIEWDDDEHDTTTSS